MKIFKLVVAYLVLLLAMMNLSMVANAQTTAPTPSESATSSIAAQTPALLLKNTCRSSDVLNLVDNAGPASDIILAIKVWTDGGVYGVKVEKGASDSDLDRVARNLIESCRFSPARKDGKPVIDTTTVGLALTAAAKIDEASIRAEYNKRLPIVQRNYANKKEYHSLHILLKSESRAQTLLAEIVAGASFEDIARQHSIDAGSAKVGGDLGWAVAENYVEPYARALREKTEPGLVNQVVKSPFGWHLIRVDGIRAATVPTFEEVRHLLEKELRRQRNTLVFPAANSAP